MPYCLYSVSPLFNGKTLQASALAALVVALAVMLSAVVAVVAVALHSRCPSARHKVQSL